MGLFTSTTLSPALGVNAGHRCRASCPRYTRNRRRYPDSLGNHPRNYSFVVVPTEWPMAHGASARVTLKPQDQLCPLRRPPCPSINATPMPRGSIRTLGRRHWRAFASWQVNPTAASSCRRATVGPSRFCWSPSSSIPEDGDKASWTPLRSLFTSCQHLSPCRHPTPCPQTRGRTWLVIPKALGDRAQAAPSGTPLGLQYLGRRILRQLSSLPLAIGLLFVISGACALGTVIEQGASPMVYLRDYPSDHPVLGFLTGDLILLLGLDHVYSNPLFLTLLLLLAACLSACTSTRQLPMLRVAQRWSFLNSPPSIQSLQVSGTLASARLTDLAVELQRRDYRVFKNSNSLYGFKGLAGRLAPIGVHAALLLVMLGGTLSSLGGFRGSVMLPQGLQVLVPDALVGSSFLARPTTSMNLVLQLDGFSIDYRPNGEVKQFYSDLRVLDFTGRELVHKTISVNTPLRCQGVTVYQTDWAISAVQLKLDGQDSVKLPVATLPDPNGGEAKLFGTFLPLPGQDGSEGRPQGITILARDLQSVVLYDSQGKFVGVRRPGSLKPITVEGSTVLVEEVIGSSGMEIKMDPGVPLVYAGFGFLILTSFISYLSHSQVWALQDGDTVHFGGRANRARYQFQEELEDIADSIPEVVGTPAAAPSDLVSITKPIIN